MLLSLDGHISSQVSNEEVMVAAIPRGGIPSF